MYFEILWRFFLVCKFISLFLSKLLFEGFCLSIHKSFFYRQFCSFFIWIGAKSTNLTCSFRLAFNLIILMLTNTRNISLRIFVIKIQITIFTVIKYWINVLKLGLLLIRRLILLISKDSMKFLILIFKLFSFFILLLFELYNPLGLGYSYSSLCQIHVYFKHIFRSSFSFCYAAIISHYYMYLIH